MYYVFFFFKQKTAYEMRISDWSSDVCSSDLGQGAEEIRAVGTFAMREALNGGVLAQLVRERFGVPVEIVDGQREAHFGFAGAVYGIDTEHGFCVDIGGGSLQIVQFQHRTAERAWTFPFGALRLTDQLITSDPPKSSELRLLRRHVRRALRETGRAHARTPVTNAPL